MQHLISLLYKEREMVNACDLTPHKAAHPDTGTPMATTEFIKRVSGKKTTLFCYIRQSRERGLSKGVGIGRSHLAHRIPIDPMGIFPDIL
jgi:hypothetical protein